MAQDGFSARANADDDCATCPDKTENIIIVGSEFEYTEAGFWLKCMFLACGFAVAQGRTPPPGWSAADRTTLLYVPLGYVRHELLALDWLRDNLGTNIVRCTSKANVLSHLRNRKMGGKTYKIKNLVAFCHGLPGYFSLNYSGPGDAMNIYGSDFERLPSDLFAPNGKVFSYACRTAVSTIFNGVLGQRIADHFGVTVRAYHRRTNYGAVMRQRSSSAALATALVAARATREGQKIALPPEHEAFPHPGMGNGVLGIWGASAEGTADYALWRTAGAVSLPAEGTTPAGEPAGYATLTPA